ncbi:uncharacterized protein [Epargyreus clarus]|uniref:uncharacterized protein isoform X3 n=1 Tax=Epargyreus clarus TaxID=520877 RepID=UPI003C2C566B
MASQLLKIGDLEWTQELVIRLMEEYKTMPELWDSRHELYKVPTAKYEAYCRLAETFQCNFPDLRKKLYSIFASYRREKGKVRKTGSSTWFLYPHMSFLPNHLPSQGSPIKCRLKLKKAKKPPLSEGGENEEGSDHSYEENEQDGEGDVAEEIVIKEEPETEEIFTPEHTHTDVRPETTRPKVRPRLPRVVRRKVVKNKEDNISTQRLLDTLKLLKKSDLMKKKDECDSFGEYIAVSLRKHDERTQSMIKQAINNILFEQEMKKYNSQQYTVVITGMEENPLMEHD